MGSIFTYLGIALKSATKFSMEMKPAKENFIDPSILFILKFIKQMRI